MVALAIGLFAAIVLLIFADGDPTTFIAFGEEATATLKYGEEALGREVVTRRSKVMTASFSLFRQTIHG